MPVTDFECAIAKSQIARFIAGENLGADVEQQLESHIDACPNCRQLLEAKKLSLLQEIEASKNNQSAVSDTVSIPTPQQEMNIGSAKADPVQVDPVQAEQSRMRAMLSARKTKRAEEIEVPAVAAAFAPKEGSKSPSIKIRLEEKMESGVPRAETKSSHSRTPLLSKLALFRKVPSAAEDTSPTGPQPPISMEALKAANKQLRNQDGGLTKPLLFMLGLAVIVGAMSYVVKDPTKLLGTKAIDPPVSKKITDFVATKKSKVLPKASTTSSGSMAQEFLDESIDPATSTISSPKAVQTPTQLTDSAKFVVEMVSELTRFRKSPVPVQTTETFDEVLAAESETPKSPIRTKSTSQKVASKQPASVKMEPTKKTNRVRAAATTSGQLTPRKKINRVRANALVTKSQSKRAQNQTPRTSITKAKKISTSTQNHSDSAVKVYDAKGNPIQ
jgi:hypothetical protein